MADPFEMYQRIGGGGSYNDLLDQLTRVDYSNLTPIQPVGLESLIDTYTFGLTPTYGTYPSLDTFDTLEDVVDVDITDEYDDIEDTNVTPTGFPTNPIDAARKISSVFSLGPLGLAIDLGLGALTDKGYFGNSGIMAQRYLSPSGFYGGNIGTKGATTFGDGIGGSVADNPGMNFGSGVDDPSLDEGDTTGPTGPASDPSNMASENPDAMGGSSNDSDSGATGGEAGGDDADTGGPFAKGGIVRKRFR